MQVCRLQVSTSGGGACLAGGLTQALLHQTWIPAIGGLLSVAVMSYSRLLPHEEECQRLLIAAWRSGWTSGTYRW